MMGKPLGETLLYVAVIALIVLALGMLACAPSTFLDSKPVYQAF